MEILIVLLLALGCFSGFVLFSKNLFEVDKTPYNGDKKVSVIIPARNEESNLPYILKSLMAQTYTPYEIIVVDDMSSDNTKKIAREFGVTVIENTELPKGWTGKTWTVWNGFKKSSGDILIFLDADVRLAPTALEQLLKARKKADGVISVVPFHYTEKFYERFSMILNILGMFTFFSPFERKSTVKSLYGSCIVATREDYEKIGGHSSISADIMDDLNIGRKFSNAGIKIENFMGKGLVSFRMYPDGISSEIQGFGKGAVLGAATLLPLSVFFVVLWILGLIASGFAAPILLILRNPYAVPFLTGYLLYTIQVFYFIKFTGKFGVVMPLLHFLSTAFFIFIILYSAVAVNFLGYVPWKGRHIEIGGKKR